MVAPACDERDTHGGAARAQPAPVPGAAAGDPGPVLAEVRGVPIFEQEVAGLVAALDGGIGPGEALQALVDNEVLAQEAAARGWGDDPAVAETRTRHLARLLLEREIGGLTAGDVPEERLREVYDRQKTRFDRGPARRVIHAVALASRKDPTAARELADRVAGAVAGIQDEGGFRRALAPLVQEHGRKRLVVERLPPFVADDPRFAAPFVEAAFAIPAPGRSSGLVETRFGWHVILLLEELPPVRVPFAEARGTIAGELLEDERRRRAERLFADLEAKTRTWIDGADVPPGSAP